jgi:crotonobetainyl-CoA:carnitine CoA-transferase CaiB-like acyl-CoA transferase
MNDGAGPLAGVRIVDLTTTFMGPYATMQLARFGADVVKIEDPRGDSTRGIYDRHGTGLGSIFLAANHGKRSVALNLKDPAGRQALVDLVREADVFISNMRPQALERLGIRVDDLRAGHPELVCALLVGFGEGGRYAGLAAYDDVIQAVSGVAAMQGAEREPEYVKAALADKIVGSMAATAVTAALYQRQVTGQGAVVTIPMFESMAAFNLLEHQSGYLFDPPQGPALYRRVTSPHRKPYRTADGYLGVVVYTDRMWLSFFDLIGRPELAEDPRYATITDRTLRIDELYELVETEMATQPSEYWIEALSERGIPVIPMRRVEDLLEDPHLQDVEFFERVAHPVEGDLLLPRTTTQFSTGVPEHLPPAPRLGEHGVEVLRSLGRSDAEIRRLIDGGTLVVPADASTPTGGTA